MIEQWLSVPNYDGYYEVSNLGNVRSVRYSQSGEVIYSRTLQPSTKERGYLGVVLSKQSDTKNHLVHRLVAMAFLPNPKHLIAVNHIDGNKTNNNVTNLEWCTDRDNLLHAYKIGLKKGNCKAVVCVETNEVFDSVSSANKAMGVTYSHIGDICNNSPLYKTAFGYHWKWKTN